jgi:hypothetical protein
MSRFDYIAYDDIAKEEQLEFKQAVIYLEVLINKMAYSRARDLAVNHLEECYMWIGKSIRDEQIDRNNLTELQEQRCNS